MQVWTPGGGSGGLTIPVEDRWPRRLEKIITNCQAGHGFTKGGVGVQVDDTADFVRGSQSVKLTTDGAGGFLGSTKTALGPFDLTGKRVNFYVKCSDWSRVQTCSLYLSSDGVAANYGIVASAKYTVSTGGIPLNGEWVKLSFSWADFAPTGAPNRAAINSAKVMLADKGNAQPFDFWLGGISYEDEPTEGMVSIAFDDGWLTQFTEARKKMDQYGFAATAYLIADVVDANPSYMTSAQLDVLQNVSGWELACHSYTVAAHNAGFDALSNAQQEAELVAIKKWAAARGYRGLDHFAMPQGKFNANLLSLLRRYFRTARTTTGGSAESRYPAMPHRLRCRTVGQTDTPAAINTLVTQALNNKEWLILLFHKIVTTPGASDEYSIANFGTVIDNLNTSGIKVHTVGDALRLAT